MDELHQRTHTGKPLDEMTLTEKILELEEDWVRLQGLKHGFFWNLRNLGPDYAFKRAKQKVQLALKGKGHLDAMISDYEFQILEDREAIEKDANAWKEGHRDRECIDSVQKVLDRFHTHIDPQKLEDPTYLKDLRTYVKIHRKNFEEKRRQLALENKFPDNDVVSVIGRKLGTLRNGFLNNKHIVVPIAIALTAGGSGWYGCMSHLDGKDKNRPTHSVGPAIYGGEFQAQEDPRIDAAALVNDATMLGNRSYNLYWKQRVDRKDGILERHDALLPLINNAKKAVSKTKEYFANYNEIVSDLARGGSLIANAWSHYEDESGHMEPYQVCTTSTDSNGNSTQTCTTHYRYVCDYVDHTWTFRPEDAKHGIFLFEEGKKKLEPIMPTKVDTNILRTKILTHLENNTHYQKLDTDGKKELEKKMLDFMQSISIEGNNNFAQNLYSLHQSVDFNHIQSNYDNQDVFPLSSSDRDHSCGNGTAPQSYYLTHRFHSATHSMQSHHESLLSRSTSTEGYLNTLEHQVTTISSKLRSGIDVSDLEDQYEDLGETLIQMQKAYNPASDFTPMSRTWRKVIPVLFLFLLGGAGGAGSYFLMRSREENRYHRRMEQRGMYG